MLSRQVVAISIPVPFRFLISGSIAAAVSFVSLYAFTEFLEIWYLTSSIIAFFLSFMFSFTLQKFWTFENRDLQNVHSQITLHLILAVANLFLNTFLVYVFVEHLHMWYMYAQFITSAVIALESFAILKWIYV